MRMARTAAWRSLVAAGALLGALACREEITAPGRCPDFCPADSLRLVDTVLTGVVIADTSIRGFTDPRGLPIMVLSDRDSALARAVMRFPSVPRRFFPTQTDTAGVTVDSTADSVVLELRVVQRDTAAREVRVLVYRLPATLDSTADFANTAAYFADSLLVDSIPVADSLPEFTTLRRALPVALLVPQAADSHVVAIGLTIRAAGRTALTVAATDFSGAPPRLKYYVHGVAPRDTFRTVFDLTPTFDTYVQNPVPPPPPAQRIVAGDQPAARAILHFQLPAYIVDSVTVVRSTLLLRTARPVAGRPRERFFVETAPIIRDFGGKSIVFTDTLVYGTGSVTAGDTGSVAIEMARVLRLWRGVPVDSLPRKVVLRNTNEGSSTGQIEVFGHTAGADAPRLHVTFIRPLRFGVP